MTKFILAAALGAAVLSLPASDTFNVPTGCTLGDATCPNWTVGSGTAPQWVVGSLGTSANPNGGGANHDVVFWNADAFGADQYSETTVTVSGGPGYVGPSVRFNASGNGYGFICGTTSLYKYTGGSASTLSSSYSSCADNDVVRLTATGTSSTTLSVTINGSPAGSDVVDSSSPWTSGSAGLDGYAASGAAVQLWTGNNAGGGGATFPSAIINAPIRCCTSRSVRFGR